MFPTPEFLVARPIRDLVPVEDARRPLRVVIASLARGGAERIVLEWLGAEAQRGREIQLAVVHSRRRAWRAPQEVQVIERGKESPETFMRSLAQRWRGMDGAVSAHLVGDELLAILWDAGIATIPTIHNTREGWRNDPRRWEASRVPFALACAEAVRSQMLGHGCNVPVVAIRHVPAAPRGAADGERRRALRAAWRIADSTLLVAAVGAFKPQKDFARAVEILAALRRSRDAALVILGGVLDRGQLAELERTVERAVALGVADHLKLPGFVDPIGPWYAASDVLLAASRHEGLSMAACEALAAGLPVVALDVGGQSEIAHERLALLAPDATAQSVADRMAALPVRIGLAVASAARAPRVWSVATAWVQGGDPAVQTIFVTANLNAGGAQRSLVNLCGTIARRHRAAVAVCGETTHGAFARTLSQHGVRCFRPAPSPDPFALAESLLVEACRAGARNVCFWNADPRVKLLVSKFAPPALRLVEASPGAYAFEEMEAERAFARTITYSIDAYHERLDLLVLKYAAEPPRGCRRIAVIPNGVAPRPVRSSAPPTPRFLVSGRIAPSKRLETVFAAFAAFRTSRGDAELHVVGQAEPRHAAYAAGLLERSAAGGIVFRGAMPGLEHLDEDFTAALVLGTHQGCPNAVLEAMAAGIPVIANASGGTGELVREDETGWLLAEDPAPGALAEAMEACTRDRERAARLKHAARERVRREFSIEAMAGRYLACLEGAA